MAGIVDKFLHAGNSFRLGEKLRRAAFKSLRKIAP